ncbi:flavohemoglobin expression-modulating QEGLA motif protein [Chryseolinea sp. T2]|uniref:flavohemoglobin expression-modulating QEGLA motif protein n=1 Tax=Chryseolinea sp. T2 TaxID=3129255 RepID=UPI003076B558
MDESKIRDLDSAIVSAAKKIKVLSALSWPLGTEEKFLEDWRAGRRTLPVINLNLPDLTTNVQTLIGLAETCDRNDPVEKFLYETASSYADAARMIMAAGTPEFTKLSSRIYGRPDSVYKTQSFSAVESARFFLELTDSLLGNAAIHKPIVDITAEDFASWMKSEVDEFFVHDTVEVMIDQAMSAKALASSARIRVRGSALFSQLDKDQLLFHEAFVHSATQLNGKKQRNLQCLGLGAPRTTRTQEGIAVMAELFTNSMDIARLRRIALRVIAIQMALEGANFIDVFQFFVKEGQTEEESVRSTQRVFRGGAVKDGIVFTKDAMYLQGLLEVHTFFRLAIKECRPELIRNAFSGRLTLADTLRLAPLFESGWLIGPTYVPLWANDLQRLSASLAYSAFIANIRLDKLYLNRAIEFEEELKMQGV